jgi:hypothetical protein
MNLVRDVSWNNTLEPLRQQRKLWSPPHNQLLVIAFYILRDGTAYSEKGGNYIDQLNPERTKRELMARLERMGFDVV